MSFQGFELYHTYKGYEGYVEYHEVGKLFLGHIINCRDSIEFESILPETIEESFHAAVDQYIEDCLRLGKSPDKPMLIKKHTDIIISL